jgi:tetratricopeptide (TPR) repeat protein
LGLAELPAVVARGYLSMLLAARGRFEEGLACCQEGTRLAETLDHPYSLGQVCWYLGYLQIVRGELGDAIRVLERGLALARERNLTYWSVVHTAGLGYAYALLGRTAEGIPLLEHAVSATGTMGFEAAQRVFLIYLAEVYVLADRIEDAFVLAARTLTRDRERAQRPYEAGALRLLGDIAARRDSRSRLIATTATRSRSPRSSACVLSSPTATSASASSTGTSASARRRRSTSRPRRRCTATWP